jgi:hypothetical protein
VCRPCADLHNTTACFPQSRKECVHHGQRAENVHFEFASDEVEWERLDRSGSQDSGVTDEKIENAICLRAYGTSPALDSWLVGDIATGQCNYAARGLLEASDFLWCDSSSKDVGALCSETKRNISPEPCPSPKLYPPGIGSACNIVTPSPSFKLGWEQPDGCVW